jgi:hypothetical protein
MALIGTISGSNGTTTSAVTGSIIIAADPDAITPTKPPGVVLFVSGAATSIGAEQPSIIFKGDTFVSGALGIDSYFQMKPVNTLRIPTNTTASYIYTSGSTNDLYFTQYRDPYTNTTRLRWLESQIQTGILHGGILSSTSGSTTYNISSGSGIIVSPNASLNDDPYPTIKLVDWGDLTGLALPSISTTQITYIAMDSTGTPYLNSTPFINGDFAQYIVLGRVLHTDKAGTNGAVNQQSVSYGTNQFRGDFVRAFGPIKLSGHTFYVSGTTGLKKDAGDSYAEGRNYTVDPDSPNYVSSTTDTAQDTSKIFYEYVNAAGDDVIDNNGNVGYAVVDFARYNNAGTRDTVGAGNKFTIQRVYWFPNSANRAFFVYYGNVIYSTIADAQAGIATEVFTEGKNTRDAAIFLGYLIVKGTLVDFTDPTTYKVVQAGSFRAVASSGAGASGTPGGADTYVQFNDASVFNGTSDFRFVKGTGTVSMANLVVTGTAAGSLVSSGTLQVKSGVGAVVGSISTSGVISGSSDLQIGGNITGSNALLVGGFVVTGSGIIESNTSTTALRVTQQGSGNAIAVEDSTNPDVTPFVVTADGRVGVGTASPAAYVFVSGTDPVIPSFVAKGPDVTVNTLSVTGSGGASTAVGFVNIDQGNYSNKYGLMISNIGAGTAGLKLSANTTGGSFAIDNMNTTPQITMTHKNLWFNSVSTAFDTSQVTYKFIENNKAVTYPNQKTFLISGNTNGPKTGSYFEVEKSGSAGSIKLLELQGDTTDNALYVSGAILASGSVFIAGDLAVSGGDITSTAAALNISAGASGLAFQRSGTSFATFVSGASGPMQLALLQAASGKTLTLAAGASLGVGSSPQVTLSGSFIDLRSGMGAPAGVDFSTEVGGLASSYLNVSSGSYAAGGSTVSTNIAKIVPGDLPQPHDLLVGASAARSLYLSGSSVVANMGNSGFSFQRDGSSYGVIQGVSGSSFTIGSAAGVISMNLVSSGNVTVRLDSDNNGTGHKFDIQDWRGISQFFVGEDGNAELSGSLAISGSTTMGATVERFTHYQSTGSTIAFDMTTDSIFYVNNPTGDITANFTKVPTTNNRIVTPTVILSQSATARTITAVQVEGTLQTPINWANGVTPIANVNKQDVFGFSLIRSGSAWKVLGQLSTYG